MEFPTGVTIDNGTYTLRELVRGEHPEGLWMATTAGGDKVWVTLRRLRADAQRTQLLDFDAPGIPRPLFIGAPDFTDKRREYYFSVVDAIPRGAALASLGPRSVRASIQLGIELCDVVASWARSSNGMIFSGLHPETIYLDQDRYVGAVPRPHSLLGSQPDFYGSPNVSFDPPGYWGSVMESGDAVFTVGLLVWWGVCGVQPYYAAGTDPERNEFEDRRALFTGPEALGALLSRALLADRQNRLGLAQLRGELATLLDR